MLDYFKKLIVAELCLFVIIGCMCGVISATMVDKPIIIKPRVVRTLMKLADCSESEAKNIIIAICKRDKVAKDYGASFVRTAYNNQHYLLDTAECKIIWKAIVVTCRSELDGFEIMEIETPWLKESRDVSQKE